MPTTTPYQSLVAAAARITATSEFDLTDDIDVDAATAFVERNRSALDDARKSLGQHCAVPLRYEADFLPEHVGDVMVLRNLARAFRVEAQLALARQDIAAVIQIGLDTLELASATRRGGLIIDQLVSVSIAANGIEVLRRVRARLDESLRRLLLVNLLRLAAEREPYAEIAARDHKWEAETLTGEESADDQPLQYDIDDGSLAQLRLLIIDTALRAAQATAGAFPPALDALAPQFIAAVPLDPFTNEMFVYRASDDAFVLYSTGPKLTDGGGSFGSWPAVMQHRADLCLDAGDYAFECTGW